MGDRLKVSIIADIHNGANHQTKKGTAALKLVDRYVQHVSRTEPDYVVDLGDRITDQDRDQDSHHLREVAGRFALIKAPRTHLIGNHDQTHLTRAENAQILGLRVEHDCCQIKGWRLIFWQAGVAFEPDTAFEPAPKEDIDWLTATLAADKTPAVIFSHLPVSGQSMLGNYYFENNPLLATYPNHGQIRRATESAEVEGIWIAGHVHCNAITTIRGIRHVTVQSLTEMSATYPRPAGAYADLTINDDTISLVVHGRDPFEVRVQRQKHRSWVDPVPTLHSEIERGSPASCR
jgi:Icc protein